MNSIIVALFFIILIFCDELSSNASLSPKRILKKHEVTIIISVTLLILLIIYLISFSNISHNIFYVSKIIVNIVEIVGIITILIAIKKYKQSENNSKLQHTMNVLSKIQSDISPMSSLNKYDLEVQHSFQICYSKLVYDATFTAFDNKMKELDKSKIIITDKIKRNIFNTVGNKISIILASTLKNKCVNDAKQRIINEILVRLFRQTFYMNKVVDINKTFIINHLYSSVKQFVTNKKYLNYINKNNKPMVDYIKKYWKI